MTFRDDVPTLAPAGILPVNNARLRVLGAFSLEIDGRHVETSRSVERLFALLAVLGGRAYRSQVAGLLWSDHAQERALSNLRATMWRMPTTCRGLITRHGAALAASDDVTSDHKDSAQMARRLLDGQVAPEDVDRSLLTKDMLPDFDEDWLVVPRERHRQLRLHALEALATLDLERGRPLDAVDTALVAVDTEPLRESAQLVLVRAHLAAGNRAEAVEQYGRFRDVLRSQLGVEPSPELASLVHEMTGQG